MEHVHRESRQGPARSAPPRGRGVSPDAAAPPGAAARWERIPLSAAMPRTDAARSPVPIVVSLSRGDHARSWAIDPGLVAILGVTLAVIGLGVLKSLLFAMLMRVL